MLEHIIRKLSAEFAMKDLGPLHYFLGIESHRRSDGLILSHCKYILELLTKFNMSNVKLISTVFASKTSLSAYEGDLLPDPTVYRQMVGARQYVTMTCPYISFAVSLVSQYMHQR